MATNANEEAWLQHGLGYCFLRSPPNLMSHINQNPVYNISAPPIHQVERETRHGHQRQ